MVGRGGQFPLSANALSGKRCTKWAIFPTIYSIPEEKLEIFEKYLLSFSILIIVVSIVVVFFGRPKLDGIGNSETKLDRV